MTTCDECGARYAGAGDDCRARFHHLLALDHSRQEPWGSRHALAFAAFALQHPRQFEAASVSRSRELLTRVVVQREPLAHVVREMRADATPPLAASAGAWASGGATYAVTIADLGDFRAESYPESLERWCRSALEPRVDARGGGASRA